MTQENPVNEEIRSKNVKLIDDGGNFIDNMPIEDALARAFEEDKDLIQLSNEEVPACRIEESGKFFYRQKKRQKNKQKTVTKEIKLRPGTEENDYQVKLKRAREFLEKKNRVKVTVSFKGREVTHQELGFHLANRIIEETGAKVSQGPSLENKTIHLLLE